MQAEQLRRLAADTGDTVIHRQLVDLAGRCDAAAATILSHWNGHADKLTSRVSQTQSTPSCKVVTPPRGRRSS
jgi:hypothetical protein